MFMREPEDADTTPQAEQCGVKNEDGWFCTRKKGHVGLHHSHVNEQGKEYDYQHDTYYGTNRLICHSWGKRKDGKYVSYKTP